MEGLKYRKTRDDVLLLVKIGRKPLDLKESLSLAKVSPSPDLLRCCVFSDNSFICLPKWFWLVAFGEDCAELNVDPK